MSTEEPQCQHKTCRPSWLSHTPVEGSCIVAVGLDPVQDEPGQSLSVLHCVLLSLRQCATTSCAPPLSHPAAISTCSEQARVNGHSTGRLLGCGSLGARQRLCVRLFEPSRVVGTLLPMHALSQAESG